MSLSTDDPPILTALAPGHVTVTAGDASADVMVYSGSALPTGTVIWSAPGDGSGVYKILPAVPSPTGVADVFALQSSGNVQAIRSNGSMAWTANVGGVPLPDFQGGLVVDDGSTIKKLDGMTGQTVSQYAYSNYPYTSTVIHTDGTIFTVDGDTLVGIDPATGNRKFGVALEHRTSYLSDRCGGQDSQSDYFPQSGPLIIAGDGYAYLLYEYSVGSVTYQMGAVGCDSSGLYTLHDKLLRVAADGTFQKIVIGDWSVASTMTVLRQEYPSSWLSTRSGDYPRDIIRYASLVTNADSGVTLALNYSFWGYCPNATDNWCNTDRVPAENVHRLLVISGGNIVSDSTLNNQLDPLYDKVTPLLQAEDGTYFGTGLSSATSMDAFDTSGNVKWSVPGFTPVMATSDGGLIAKSSSGQYVTFDQNGVANGMLPGLPTQSWIGNSYQLGSVKQVASTPVYLASSFLAISAGNLSSNGTAVNEPWFPPLGTADNAAIYAALDDLIARLKDPALSDLAQQNIFTEVGQDANGYPLTTASFLRYLTSKRPRFFNGLASNYCEEKLAGIAPCSTSWLFSWFNGQSVKSYLSSNPLTDALSGTPSYPLLAFFRPTSILAASQGKNLGNEADVFHEALHGISGKQDSEILFDLGFRVDLYGASCRISKKIEETVLTHSNGLDQTTSSQDCPNEN